MADNFLEKQMERYREGRTVVRPVTPSLDVLLRRLAEQDGTGATEKDTGYIVKEAQLQAVLRSARILFGDCFDATVSEKEQSIMLKLKGMAADESGGSERGVSEHEDSGGQGCFGLGNSDGIAGGIAMVMRLKAAELKLCTSIETADDSEGLLVRFWR